MTITSLKDRWCGSYSCGTDKAMEKGSCSTTNYIISECNFRAIKSGIRVEIYGIPCAKEKREETRFGITHTVCISKVRDYETMLMQVFMEKYGCKPVLCVQKGRSPIDKMKVKELKKELTDRKIKFTTKMKKKDLQELLKQAEEKESKYNE